MRRFSRAPPRSSLLTCGRVRRTPQLCCPLQLSPWAWAASHSPSLLKFSLFSSFVPKKPPLTGAASTSDAPQTASTRRCFASIHDRFHEAKQLRAGLSGVRPAPDLSCCGRQRSSDLQARNSVSESQDFPGTGCAFRRRRGQNL